MPNLFAILDDATGWDTRFAGRLILSLIATALVFAVAFLYAKKPRPNRERTWAEAMAGAVAVLAAMFLLYAIVPHEWISYADSRLGMTKDEIFLQHGYKGKDFWMFTITSVPFPFTITWEVISDMITMGIYTVFLVGNLLLFKMWQQRPVETEDAEVVNDVVETPAGKSRYGRPLLKRG